jgi:eukaryotic-like serine/threonine-protein kinase
MNETRNDRRAPRASAPPPGDDARSRVGTPLNEKWRIDAVIGEGGMGTVFAATHRNGARAALKVLHPELTRADDVRERFLREGRIANQIEHPSAVRILDDDVSDRGEAFLVMELLHGDTLEGLLRERGKLDLEEALRIIDPVLELLVEAHGHGIVHRDIKPANIFLTSSGRVKVLDFGIARLREQRGGPGATRQGTALGTPQFMSPEQALGLGDQIDGRADVFSVGACMYAMLSGRRLNDTEVEAEAFVLAATRPAPSVALAAPELPAEIVAAVDKALAYERNDRFPDAGAMRSQLLAVAAALRAGQLSGAPSKRAGVLVRGEVEDDEEPAEAEAKEQLERRLRNIWKLLGMFMASTRQYGWNHPEVARQLEAAYDATIEALSRAPDSVRWDVTPYSFSYEGSPIWEPDRPPFDRLPFQLFGDGMRRIQLRPGLSMQELRDLTAIMMKDRGSGEFAEGDAVSNLWDRHFDHVAYLSIDSFAEGDAEERDAFERMCAGVAESSLEQARIDKDWLEGSLEAQALGMNLSQGLREAANAANALSLDPVTRAALAAQLSLSSDQWTKRYVDVLAQAWMESQRGGDGALVANALREWTRDHVQLHNSPAVFAMFEAVAASLAQLDPKRAKEHESALILAMLPPETLAALIAQLVERGTRLAAAREIAEIDPTTAAGLGRALEHLQSDAVFPAAFACLDASRGTAIGPALLAYVKRWAAGHEAEIGERLQTAQPELGVELVRALAALRDPVAQRALNRAFRSPHAELRLEALGHLPEGADAFTEELQRMLDDRAPEVRTKTLGALRSLKAKSIGPALARRIQASSFHGLPLEERRLWFEALAELHPARAEDVAVEMLGMLKGLPAGEQEQTRIVAVGILARIGGPESCKVVEGVAKRRLLASGALREAAEKAAAAIRERSERGGGERASGFRFGGDA